MSPRGRDTSLRTPLLDPFESLAQQGFLEEDEAGWGASLRQMAKDFGQQLSLAGPLAVNLVAANAVAVVNLYFVARGGTLQLAAAALGNNVAVMVGRLVLLGLCGALDTLAAQAWGAGKERRLPLLLQRTVLFLWAHCLPLSAVMMALPAALGALGQDRALGAMMLSYLGALLPSVWLEALSRPITRVLVARGVVGPQMIISLAGLPLNVATNYLLVVRAGWGYVGAAAAMSSAAGYDVILLLLYVAASGQWSDVIGRPSARAFRGWRPLARLAYPAASMKCAESWAFTICTLAASLLPDACTATAAVGVSYNVYGVLFISFVACSTAACVTVGNRLGAGDARGARLAAAGSLLVVPPAWGLAAAALLLPACQDAVMSLFVAPGAGAGGDGDALRGVLRHMFVIVAGLVLLDGVQTVMSGIIQGCGRQRAGALVNFAAFYAVALPLALLLAFRVHLHLHLPAWLRPEGGGHPGGGGGVRELVLGLGLGPEGLYLGMAAGPAIQVICYTAILLGTQWEAVARSAEAAALQSCSSLTGLLAAACRRRGSGAASAAASGCASPSASFSLAGLAGLTGAGGAPLVRSAGSSGNGMLSPFSPAWHLPAIEEAAREGRDSSSGSFGSGAGGGQASGSDGPATVASAAAAAAASASNWRRLARAFSCGGGQQEEEEEGWKGVQGEELGDECEWEGPRGAVGGAGGASPAGSGRASRRTRRRGGQLSSNALRLAAASGSAAVAAAAAKFPPAVRAATGDTSPDTAACSETLIETHGSAPRADPAAPRFLAVALDPGSPAAMPPAGADTDCGVTSAPGNALTLPSRADNPALSAAGAGASVPVPVSTVAAVAAAARATADIGCWFRFGWGRAAPAAISEAAAAAAFGTGATGLSPPGASSSAAAAAPNGLDAVTPMPLPELTVTATAAPPNRRTRAPPSTLGSDGSGGGGHGTTTIVSIGSAALSSGLSLAAAAATAPISLMAAAAATALGWRRGAHSNSSCNTASSCPGTKASDEQVGSDGCLYPGREAAGAAAAAAGGREPTGSGTGLYGSAASGSGHGDGGDSTGGGYVGGAAAGPGSAGGEAFHC